MVDELVQAIIKVMTDKDDLNRVTIFDRINGIKYEIVDNGDYGVTIDIREN